MGYLDTATAGTLTHELAGHIWSRTQGYLGDTHRLITTAILDAFDTGDVALTQDHLYAVRLSARAEAAEVDIRKAQSMPSRREQNKKGKP